MRHRISIPCFVACAVLAWAVPAWASFRAIPGPSLPDARADVALTLASNGEVWLVGGTNGAGSSTTTVWRWVPGASSWTTGPSLSQSTSGGWLFTRADGSIVYVDPVRTLSAHLSAALTGWTSQAMTLAPVTATMTGSGQIVACSATNCSAQSGAASWTTHSTLRYEGFYTPQIMSRGGGELFAFIPRRYTYTYSCTSGGVQTTCSETRYELVVDRFVTTWSSYNAENIRWRSFGSVVTPAGYVVVSGGLDGTNTPTSRSVSVTPTNSYRVGSIPGTPVRPGLVSLADGGVLAVGGGNSSGQGLFGVSHYDPVTDAWRSQERLIVGRYLAATIRLADGRVLVVGGFDGLGTRLASTEILEPLACSGPGACLLSEECLDGYCVDMGCTGACARGDVAGAPGLCMPAAKGVVPRTSCGNYLCNGTSRACPTSCSVVTDCTSGSVCHGGQCIPGKPLGDVCSAGTQCLSGQCVDGVCCNTGCGAACDACNLSGSVGTCTPRPDGFTGSCGLYACDGTNTSCPTTCATHADCVSTHYCIDSLCKPGRPNGYDCTVNTQCDSLKCVDGVCCGALCDGCERCNRADAKGVCTLALAGDPGRCAPYLCDGASASCLGVCDASSDCTPAYFCDLGGSSCVPKRAQGVTCTANEQCTNGRCVDNVCCESLCEGGCDRCNLPGSSGLCRPNAAGTDGSCGGYRCDGGASCPASCASDSFCAGGYACIGGECRPGLANGLSCSANGSCASGVCADGVCCSSACNGACDRCDAPGSVGQCTPRSAGTGGVPSCVGFLCDGTSPACPSSCTATSCAPGFSCTAGACVPATPQGVVCSTSAQCLTGACVDGVCCNGACGGSCEACNVPGRVGTCAPVVAGSFELACGLYTCDGSQQACPRSCTTDAGCRDGHFCDAGTCKPRKSLGTQCDRAGECGSSFCADGVCCDGACTGACESCRTGAPGRCSSEIAGASAPECGAYACDGTGRGCPAVCRDDAGCAGGFFCNAGSCVPKRATGTTCTAARECGSGFCADGICCGAACSGSCDRCNLAGKAGICSPVAMGEAGTPSCTPFLCSGVSGTCPVACADDSQCVGGRFCEAGRCLDRKSNGMACSATRECASGFCVDGVCCDGGCTGSCSSCASGSCRPVVGVPPPNRAACAGSGACGGRCNGLSPNCTYPTSTTVCRPGLCTDGVATSEARCDGAGGCPGSTSIACDPFVCGEGACLERCDDDGDCGPGHGCVDGTCTGHSPIGTACRVDAQCASGSCADGVCCDRDCGGGCEQCNAAGSLGTCTARATEDATCAPYRCIEGAASCATGCSNDADCAEGHACAPNGRCVPRVANGSTCTRNDECASGVCADGICCDRACDGACERCSRAGVCSLVSGEPVEGRCGGAGVCAGRCDGVSPACVFPTSSCEPGFCAQGIAFAESRCNGAGACVTGASEQCFAGCEGTSCAAPGPASAGCASMGGAGLGALAGLLLVRRRRSGKALAAA